MGCDVFCECGLPKICLFTILILIVLPSFLVYANRFHFEFNCEFILVYIYFCLVGAQKCILSLHSFKNLKIT
jgi:hypothetical protein